MAVKPAIFGYLIDVDSSNRLRPVHDLSYQSSVRRLLMLLLVDVLALLLR